MHRNTTSVKVLIMIDMDVTHNVLDYKRDHVAESNILQERKECEEKYCKKVENEES